MVNLEGGFRECKENYTILENKVQKGVEREKHSWKKRETKPWTEQIMKNGYLVKQNNLCFTLLLSGKNLEYPGKKTGVNR